MREPLSGLLRSRYGSLYGSRRDPEPWPFRLWGFEHGDGWFGLIDALSAVVACRVAERALAFSITQVKAKLGTLRYYAGGMDEFCRGAKAFAEMMSGRLSERSGRPGLPSRIGRYICTLAPAEDPGAEVWPEFEPTERFIAGCDPTRAVALVRSAWPMTHIDVPAGHADLADVLMDFLTADETAVPPPSAILIRTVANGQRSLIIDMANLDERRLGGIAVAARLAAMWIDPLTGDIGPVDDLGRPAWAARLRRA